MADVHRINPIYRDALLDARDAGYAINRAGEERLMRAYAEMVAEILRDVARGEITPERAEALRREILTALGRMEQRVERVTGDSIRLTMDTVTELHRRVTEQLVAQFAPGAIRTGAVFDRLQARALGAMVARAQNAATFQTLFRRRLMALVPQVDTYLDVAVARGVEAGRGTMDLARILANDDQRLLNMLDRLRDGPGGDLRRQLHAGVGQIDWSEYGIDDADVKDLQTLLYDARRIHVSETNNALRESNSAAMDASPVVTAAKWQLSGRHSIPDECDVLASADMYGYGGGYWPPDKWPLAPHPFCGCVQGGPVKFRRPSEWSQPKPASNALSRDPGDEDLYAPFAGDWTENRLERARATIRGVVAELERGAGPLARRAVA